MSGCAPREARCRRRWAPLWGRYLSLGLLALGWLQGCSAATGRLVGQEFVSPRYAFAVRLPEDAWQVVANEPSVLTLAHTQLAAGITINVTCDQQSRAPLDILTRHLFFGFRDVDVLRQEPQVLNGVPALKTVARARLEGREVQLSSYVVRHAGCVYDLVYFASPPDFPGGEADFERMVAQFRLRP
jgi:predicted Zn-dependent protease